MTRRFAFILLLALLSAVFARDRGLYLFDEGIIMYGAHSLVQGEPLYGHARVNYGPGILWTVAALFRLLGESMLWPRLMMALVFVVMVLLCRSILLAAGGGEETADLLAIALIGYRAFLFPHWTMTSYTPLSVLFFLATVRLLLGAPPRFLAAGFAAGVAFLFKQNTGILAVAFVSIAAVVGKDRRVVAILRGAVGLLAALVPALLCLAATGSISGFWHYAIVGNARIGATWSMPFPWLLSDLDISRRAFFYVPAELFAILFRHPKLTAAGVRTHLLPLAIRLLFLVPPVVVALLGVRALKRRHRGQMLLASGAALLLLLAWPICTVLHFATAALLTLVALAALGPAWPRTVRMLLCLVAASGLLLEAVSSAADQRKVKVGDFTVRCSPRQARRYTSMVRFIDSHVKEGERIFVLPTAPMYYFATGRENAIADDFILPPWSDQRRIAEIVREMKERPIRVVIRNRGEFPFMPRLAEFGAPILDELRRSYRLVYRTPPPGDEVFMLGKRRKPRSRRGVAASSRRRSNSRGSRR